MILVHRKNERSALLFPMAKATGKQIGGAALRERVLDIALELFSERGYFNTSILDIRRQAQVSIGAIYHHFERKAALARGLYLRLLDRIDAEINAILMRQAGCLARCRAVVTFLFELTEAEPQVMQFIMLAKHGEYLPDEPPICSSSPFVRMRQMLEAGIAAGEVRQLEPWVAATAMFGGAMRMMNLHLDGALQKPLPSYLDEVVDCGWRAVRS